MAKSIKPASDGDQQNIATPATPPVGAAPIASAPRKIPGNLPYLTASGTLKKVLDRIIEAQRPDKFNADFLENVLKLTGGAARGTIPVLKKMGFLASDGTPTELYGRFRTNGARGTAALQGLRSGFSEIFKRSEYAHAVPDGKLRDIIVEITGLTGGDPVVTAIKGTFNVIRAFVSDNPPEPVPEDETGSLESSIPSLPAPQPTPTTPAKQGIGLAYNINIVLPETSDINVLNAIFQSIKENLMR